jgi:hypothetical protein
MTSDPSSSHQRLRRFVDHRLQTTLIVALLVVQLLLVAACVWQLHGHLAALLEAQTYRVHFEAPPTADAFRSEAVRLLTRFAIANLALVVLVELSWRAGVGVVLQRYRSLLSRVQQLDFVPTAGTGPSHPLLHLVHRWRATERQRLSGLRQCRAACDAARGDALVQQACFEEIGRLLPPLPADWSD